MAIVCMAHSDIQSGYEINQSYLAWRSMRLVLVLVFFQL